MRGKDWGKQTEEGDGNVKFAVRKSARNWDSLLSRCCGQMFRSRCHELMASENRPGTREVGCPLPEVPRHQGIHWACIAAVSPVSRRRFRRERAAYVAA